MIPIYSAAAFRQWDLYTLEKKGIPSVELMEKAAVIFVDWLLEHYARPCPVVLLCGTGNNGGDGLVIARLLKGWGYSVQLYIIDFSGRRSEDFQYQLSKLPRSIEPVVCHSPQDLPDPDPKVPVVEALFGTGLSRPLTDPHWVTLVDRINQWPNLVYSVDLPAGLLADQATLSACVEADFTLSFEAPKLAFFFPENARRLGNWTFRSIGLDSGFQEVQPPEYWLLDATSVSKKIKKRSKFDHKGVYGHALLIAGARGKMGAAVLAAKAALRTGLGLLTVHLPESGLSIVQTAVPEAMCSVDVSTVCFSQVPPLDPYQVIGIGSGIGQTPETMAAFRTLLSSTKRPMVLDADALNLLAADPSLWGQVPPNSLLTPHPGEFDRLFGPSETDFERMEKQVKAARQYQVFLLRKGAFTLIAAPDGRCWFNATGNPGMATAGSGDVLTGMLTSLLAQGYSPEDAALLGVYLHGLAGDLGASVLGQAALLAGDLVEQIGAAYLKLTSAT